MTLWQLKKLIDKAVAEHGKRVIVAIDPKTFGHSLPEVQIFDVCGGLAKHHIQLDQDGCATNKDGSERYRLYFMLYGAEGQSCCGDPFETCNCNNKEGGAA